MKKTSLVAALFVTAPGFGLWVAGCGEDDARSTTTTTDSGVQVDAQAKDASDSGESTTCNAPTGLPPRALLSINGPKATSELVVFNVDEKRVESRTTYSGNGGLTFSHGATPFLLEQASDIVAKLDPIHPSQVVSQWNVAGDDTVDGGANANPSAIVVPNCGKGYVLRFNRNKIAVIDTAVTADAGTPSHYIDLSSLVQPDDKDGIVNMTSAVYAKSSKRIYVLLGNEDLNRTAADGFTMLCADTKASIVAIDTAADKVVSLGGTAPGGGIALEGYNPFLGSSMWYDAARERMLVATGGCNTAVDGGAGPVARRRIEEVDLKTGNVKTLVDLNKQEFPTGLTVLDDTHAVVHFVGGSAFFWNPTQTTLGAPIANGLDYGTHDGKGHILGVRKTTLDGGAGPIEVVRVTPNDSDGGVPVIETLGTHPFTNADGWLNGIEMWPQP
jgi:hypothetical protein